MSRLTYSLGALLLAVCALIGVRVSSAEFTDGSVSRTQIGAARDWTPPVVSVNDPGFVVVGNLNVTVAASDADTWVATVRIELAPVGSSTWTVLCTDSASPWSCSWNTTSTPDGDYRIRAVATDADGNSATSVEVTTAVSNTTAIVLDSIPTPTGGDITLAARITNPGWGSTSIKFQRSPAGANTWSDVSGTGCAGSGVTRTCVFNTAMVADGTYDWRAVGTVGMRTYYDYQRDIVIDNTGPTVSQALSGSTYLSGAITWTATATDNLSGVQSVAFQYRLGAGSWETCATDTSSPYACSFDASTFADGSYDFRTVATDGVGNTATSTSISRTVDNQGPVVELSVPAGPISGPVAMTATASDAGAGMTGGSGGVQFQYRVQGVTAWTTCGTDTTSPYACTTSTLADGTYEFRALATNANNRATTSPIVTRVVDTVVASVALTAPAAGTIVWGSTTVTASASSNKGVGSVTLQYQTGAGSWTNVCPADTVSPYTCTWNAATLPHGSYQLRAVMSHGSGLSLTSSPVSVVVPQPGGFDVQGATSLNSTPSTGDAVALTYTDSMNLSTIASGLTPSTPVNATATLVGNNGSTTMTFSGVNLGTVVYGQQYVTWGRSVSFAVTVSASTTTANGITVTRITVTLGARTGGMSWYLSADSSLANMTWSPSSAAEDAAGNAAATTTTTETGTNDRDM